MPQTLQDLTAEEHARVLHSLDALQEAQGLIERAAELLSPVPGFATEWEGIRQLFGEVKSQWHAIDEFRAMVTRDTGRDD